MIKIRKIIEDLGFAEEVIGLDLRKSGFNLKVKFGSSKIKLFSELLSRSGFQLNMITCINNEVFTIFYIFSSIADNLRVLAEVQYNNKTIESIGINFKNAIFYENDINEIYGLIFDIKEEESSNSDLLFYLDQDSFNEIDNEPFFYKVLTCGEFVKKIYPEKGYHSRFLENFASSSHWSNFIVNSSRLDSYSGYYSNLCYCQTLELALGIEVPEKAKYVRVFFSEIFRMIYNLHTISLLLNYFNFKALSSTVMMMRENVKEIVDYTAGRSFIEINKVGGIIKDVDDGIEYIFDEKTKDILKELDEIRKNFFLKERLEGVCNISKKDCLKYGLTGIHIRSAGFKHDMRKTFDSVIYKDFPFLTSKGEKGDEFERLNIKIEEIVSSYGILLKIIKKIKYGPFLSLPEYENIPEGDFISSVESVRGRMSYYIKGNGTEIPEAVKIETPSVSLYTYFNGISGIKISDLPLYQYSTGFSMAEVDK